MDAKNQSLLLIDAVAIISIVLYHAIFLLGKQYDKQYDIVGLGVFGLALFSFSAGYKLMLNHGLELQNKEFLRQYMIKRFKRLYKPYIGYTLLALPCLLAMEWVAKSVFHLNYPGLNIFDHPIKELVWRFIIGDNPFVYQLWYLVMLIEVIFFCLLVLYVFSNIKVLFGMGLFGMGFTVGLLLLFPQDAINYRIIIYGTIFIIGMFFATKIVLPEKIAITVLKPLLIVGSYSFYIYLFHMPFLLPIPGRILVDVLHIHSIFVPIFLTLFTVAATMIIYRGMKMFGINRLFE